MVTSEAPATADEAVRGLRGLAHEWVDDRRADPDVLIQAALRALVAGVDTPSLWLLAWLLGGEEDQASELFGQVMDELGFGFHPPEEYWEGRLALARWWAAEIVGGWLDPFVGAELIIENVAEAYGPSEELAPLLDALEALWDRGPQTPPDEAITYVTRAARELVARIPLPSSTPSDSATAPTVPRPAPCRTRP
ncbi:hypothetical protein [Kitasatospora sp. NPDC058218]|uniref:hypothetical protein n=1 Tax=Kitasatospora sp. NPDC058218 TaxID=3346385 RepID=UPI0036D866FE